MRIEPGARKFYCCVNLWFFRCRIPLRQMRTRWFTAPTAWNFFYWGGTKRDWWGCSREGTHKLRWTVTIVFASKERSFNDHRWTRGSRYLWCDQRRQDQRGQGEVERYNMCFDRKGRGGVGGVRICKYKGQWFIWDTVYDFKKNDDLHWRYICWKRGLLVATDGHETV